MVPGGDRAPLHRPARLLLPQRDAPHAEARHHHHPAPGHPGDTVIFSYGILPFKYIASDEETDNLNSKDPDQ